MQFSSLIITKDKPNEITILFASPDPLRRSFSEASVILSFAYNQKRN